MKTADKSGDQTKMADKREGEAEPDQDGFFAISDPVLLENMILTRDIDHPVTGVALLTKGHMLTKKTITQLENLGVTAVQAAPLAEERVLEAVEQIRGYLHSVEKVIGMKSRSVRSAAILFQELGEVKELERIMFNQMQNVLLYFNDHAADSLIKLNTHHPDSAHHSIITGFNTMAVARELRWDEEEILVATMAAITHDIGKVKVPLHTLEWPGNLNPKQWQEIQLHTLFGGVLLKREVMTTAVMVALSHHEWYADTKSDQGYGGLTKFRKAAQESLELDIDQFLAQATPQQLEMIQICTITNMVAAMEESNPQRGVLSPLQVLLIMNNDARKGRFNPVHYRAWHKIYTRKHRRFLPKGLRFPLPREQEQVIDRAGKEFVVLDVIIRKLSLEELQQMELLPILKNYLFDLDAITKEDGISISRIERRGVEVHKNKLKSFGIHPEKKVKVLLPSMEKRLNMDDLIALGVEGKLADKRLMALLKRSKNGVTIPDLHALDVHIPKEKLASAGDSLEKKIEYDLLVLEELGACCGLFAIVRAGDRLEDLEKANAYNTLDPLQSYLLNKIGLVEIDFSALTMTLPDLNGIVQGRAWRPTRSVKKV